MGGQPSRTRKYTMENEQAGSVIKVSNDVIERLKGIEDKVKRESQEQQAQQADIDSTEPPPFFHEQPTWTSLQIRQESAAKLKENDEYWLGRLSNLEQSHNEMKRVMEEEYNRAVEEMHSLQVPKYGRCSVPCIDNRQKVIACYQKYPNEPMRCEQEVKAFAECVDMKRIGLAESRG